MRLALLLAASFLVLVAGAWLLGEVVQAATGTHAQRLDSPVARFAAAHRAGWLTTAMRVVTACGSSSVLVPLVLLVGATLGVRRRSWFPLAFLAVTQVGAILLYDVAKVLVGRPRPSLLPLVATATGYAFPSGHSTQAVAIWGAFAVLAAPVLPSAAARWVAVGSSAAVAALIGLSRVYLGVHWTTDVIGGWLLGAAWLALVVRHTRAWSAPAAR